MVLALYSSCLYGYFAVFRMDLGYGSYEEYLNSLNLDFHQYYFFSKDQIKTYNRMELVFELIFLFVMLLNAITDYQQQSNGVTVRDFKKVLLRYIQEDLYMELIPLIPFRFIPFRGNNYLYFIKCLRLKFALMILDVKKLQALIRALNKQNRDKVC